MEVKRLVKVNIIKAILLPKLIYPSKVISTPSEVIQSNLSNTDTEGTEQSVLIREVSVLERSRQLRHF